MAGKINELRAHFLDKYSGSIIDDTYDSKDVKWVKKSDALLQNVLDTPKVKDDIKKGADLLNEMLTFRAKIELSSMKEEDIHPELQKSKPIEWHGVDKKGQKIMIFHVAKNKKGHLIEETKKCAAFYYNQHYFNKPEEKIVMIFNFLDAGVSNLDLDVAKFLVACGNTYFPRIGDYTLNFKMGLALEAVYKVISGWFDPHQAKVTKSVTKSNIQEYIDPSNLHPYMIKE